MIVAYLAVKVVRFMGSTNCAPVPSLSHGYGASYTPYSFVAVSRSSSVESNGMSGSALASLDKYTPEEGLPSPLLVPVCQVIMWLGKPYELL